MGSEPRQADGMVGQQVTHYRVLSELGQGGMGVVYLAQDTALDRKVALKFIRSDLIGGAHAEDRLLREARLASALDHPNIGTIYEVGEWQGHHFIAMAYYEGETLAARMERGLLPVAEATAILVQVANALVRAHASGVVHRDLKPANIHLVRSEIPALLLSAPSAAGTAGSSDSGVTAKLLDFGLSRQATDDTTAATRITAPGTTVGTVAYMSPEQAQGEDVDASADLWALGVIAYELFAGRRPFPGVHPAAVMHAILYEGAPDLCSLRPELPKALCALIHKALARDKASRHPSAVELLAELQAAAPAAPPGRPRGLSLHQPRLAVPLVLVLLLGVWGGARVLSRSKDMRWARHQALPEITRLAEAEQFSKAFALAVRAEAVIPGDPMLERLWPTIARTPRLRSDPAGATVSYAPYDAPGAAWVVAGATPLDGVRVPAGFFRWRFEKPGFETLEVAGASDPASPVHVPEVTLEAAGKARPGMILIPASDAPHNLFLPGFEHLPPVQLDAFWMDRFEVTNEQYKAFVDAGGYRRREFWVEPFEEHGRAIGWDEAISRFHDATGRPGPATWIQGEFPAGQARIPVSGVSWYEASAYARFVGKSLPTVYHWTKAAEPRISSWVVPRGNFGAGGAGAPMPVGSRGALHMWGHEDLAGNVKEWSATALGDGRRYILGGGWDEPLYMFNDPDARSPFARTTDSGFRCVKYSRELGPALLKPLAWSSRDYSRETPVPQSVFEIYRRLYAYDKVPLRASVEATEDGEDWRRKQVSVPTAYGSERMKILVYLPKKAAPPCPTVVYFPGSNMLRTRSFDQIPVRQFDFILKSGRAVVLPVYKGTLDRPSELSDSTANPSAAYRDHVIAWVKDFMRAVDYLESRSDLTIDRLAYVGLSWGGRMGSLVPALDERIKVAVLIVGGFPMQRPMPEVDHINFAPRVHVPVLMLNGRYDFFFPVDASQNPMFERLGTPPAQKRHVLYDAGHGIPRVEMIRETLDWLDRYQGVPSAVHAADAR
jgi:serine/threonine protein kinase/formylglycine-generating enzyme required for sulfatase activity/dienelactone hydrolase